MTHLKIKLVVIILFLAVTSCVEKDDLTLPVRVFFKIGISPNQLPYYEYLDFTQCQIGIQSISFEGTREEGPDIHFVTNPALNLQTLSFNEKPTAISIFDLPQGVYSSMKWDISLKCIETERPIDDRNESSPCIGIIIKGNYTNMGGFVIPFILAIDKPVLFSVMSFGPAGESTIVLSVDKEYEATVLFAPEEAFSAVDRQFLEDAELSGDLSHPEIIISSVMNEELYLKLVFNIFLSASAVIK